MLQSDEKIVDILLKEKKEGNKLLQHFKISYPSDKVAEQSNTIFVGVADYQVTKEGFDFDEGTDLIDILVVTKKKDNIKNKKINKNVYSESKFIIKMVLREIRKILYKSENVQYLGSKPSIKNMTPEYNPNYVLNRGHMLVQIKVIDDNEDIEDEIDCVCKILMGEIEYG